MFLSSLGRNNLYIIINLLIGDKSGDPECGTEVHNMVFTIMNINLLLSLQNSSSVNSRRFNHNNPRLQRLELSLENFDDLLHTISYESSSAS
jgi:hypothetical protein